MKTNKSERGQALILIAIAMVALVALTALAIDGGKTMSDRRQAQGAADAAAYAIALQYAKTTGNTNTWEAKGLEAAATNGFDNTTNNSVTVTYANIGNAECPNSYGQDITVTVNARSKTFFSSVVGINETANNVKSTVRVCRPTYAAAFDGNAIVALNPDPNANSFDSGQSGSVYWNVKNGGILSNSNAHAKSSNSVDFPTGNYTTAVGTVSGFTDTSHSNSTGMQIKYPSDVESMLPATPACSGTATLEYQNADGKVHEQVGKENKGSKLNVGTDGIVHEYAAGVYCLYNIGKLNVTSGVIKGTGVTLYIMDESFSVTFTGHTGGIELQAPTSGPYAGIILFSGISKNPDCSNPGHELQTFNFRGNGSATNVGTIFLPSACIDFRGNTAGNMLRTQVIGYEVTSNGTADVYVNYSDKDNYKAPVPPSIQLQK